MLINRELILAKVESTYNTDAVPVGTDAILVESISAAPSGVRMAKRKAVRSTFGPFKSIYGGRLETIELVVELKGSGAAGTAPEIGTLFRGCGFDETIVASTSVTYQPVSTGQESLTIYYYQDGLLTKLTGARGTFTGAVTAGDICRLTFSFTGHVSVPTDTAIATPTYDSTVPAIALGINFDIGGFNPNINSFSFDIGNEIVTPTNIKKTDGYGEIRLGDRAVVGKIDPEAELVATNPYISDWVNGVSAALTTNSIGGTAGNIVTISMPSVSYNNVANAERDGIRTYDIDYEAIPSSGDDEVSFAFT